MNSREPSPPAAIVVDDNEDNRRIFEIALERAGYEVSTAVDGKQALETLASRHFHLMLLDLQMPELDGRGVLQHLQTRPDMMPKYVVIATANAHMTAEDVEHMADYVIYKPVEVAALITLGKRLLPVVTPKSS